MPYYVSWEKEGRIRRFAYPHADLRTALAFAGEVLNMDHSDVWVSDESGQKVASRQAIAQYNEDMDES